MRTEIVEKTSTYIHIVCKDKGRTRLSRLHFHAIPISVSFRCALNSRYRAITFSLSCSIMDFCAIDRTPSRFPPSMPPAATRRGRFLNSGGALAMSLSRRGADEECSANSLRELVCGSPTGREGGIGFFVLFVVALLSPSTVALRWRSSALFSPFLHQVLLYERCESQR